MEKPKDSALAEAISLLAAVILALGLIAAGFYAQAHGIDDWWFFFGAVMVIVFGIIDKIF